MIKSLIVIFSAIFSVFLQAQEAQEITVNETKYEVKGVERGGTIYQRKGQGERDIYSKSFPVGKDGKLFARIVGQGITVCQEQGLVCFTLDQATCDEVAILIQKGGVDSEVGNACFDHLDKMTAILNKDDLIANGQEDLNKMRAFFSKTEGKDQLKGKPQFLNNKKYGENLKSLRELFDVNAACSAFSVLKGSSKQNSLKPPDPKPKRTRI